ncbi:MAG: glutamyl-tRNA reductase [Chloroflexota bacterium]
MSGLEIVAVGLNHKTAPVDVREMLAFSPATVAATQVSLLDRTVENIILSTCNRSEVFAVIRSGYASADDVVAFLANYHGAPVARFAPYLQTYTGLDAIKHLFAVAAGLDSMILGEPQILGQVRAAYENSIPCHTAGPILTRAFHAAMKVGKKVRSDTAISRHAVSISYAAVEQARRIFGGLDGRRILLIGAGKMAELAARTLLDSGVSDVVVANRTLAKATELAERFGGRASEFACLPELLAEADVVISSTGAPDFVLTPAPVRRALTARNGRPLFLIDIAVPRDVDPAVQEIEGVYLYDIDDLQAVCAANVEERRKEVGQARAIIAAELTEFAAWWESLEVVPTISALRERADVIRRAEVEKTLNRFGGLSDEQRASLDAMARAIVNKILHQPITRLKAKSAAQDGAEYARVLRELFALDEGA